MAQRLFVGNLPFTVDSQKLQELFSQAGQVVVAEVKTDRMTGRSRGFGFVEMADDESTQKAIDTFNNYDIEGRKIVVNVARPREENTGGGDRGGYRGGGGGQRGGYRDNRGGGGY